MQPLDALWSACGNAAPVSFSICLLKKFHFDFHLAEHWPASQIRRALQLNVASTGETPGGWKIYGLTTREFDLAPCLARFPRDRHGQLDLQTVDYTCAFYDSTNQLFRAYDFATKRAAYIYPPERPFTPWELHSPFKEFWHLWALKNNALLIHSGVVTKNGMAVLLPGAGGKGKSTTVLSCLGEGMQTTGDDYNLLHFTDHGVYASALYGNLKTKSSRQAFDFPMTASWQSEILSYAGKIIYYPPAQAEIWDMSCPRITGIMCPEIAAMDEPRIIAIKPAELINTLAISSIMQSPFMAKEYLAGAVRLGSRMRHAKLLLSARPAANAACIGQWISEGACSW